MPELQPTEIIEKITSGEIIGVSIDTCIFDQKGRNFNNKILKSLEQFKNTDNPVYLSEVVSNEILKHFSESVNDTQEKLIKAIEKHSRVWDRSLTPDNLPEEFGVTEDASEFAKFQLSEFLDLIGANVVPVDGEYDVSGELLRVSS